MFFLADLLAQILDLNACGGRQSFGVVLDLIGQRRRPLGIVFIRDIARAQELFHAPGEADRGESALEHQPIVAGQHSGDDVGETLLQQLPPTFLVGAGVALEFLSVLLSLAWDGMLVHRKHHNPPLANPQARQACTFGSGYASVW